MVASAMDAFSRLINENLSTLFSDRGRAIKYQFDEHGSIALDKIELNLRRKRKKKNKTNSSSIGNERR